jgi:hypothetical protein
MWRDISEGWLPMLQIVPIVMLFALQGAQPQAVPDFGLPITGVEAEEFLRTAEILEVESITERGVTQPKRVTLSDGSREVRAVFKTIDEYRPFKDLGDRRWPNFRDSYKHEVAAYELDKMLGLDMVPPCVVRRVGSQKGSLCLWVEGAMSEVDRIQRKIQPPDVDAWNRQVQVLRTFLALIGDMDYKNLNNVLLDPDFKIYKIDSSRGFRTDKTVIDEHAITRLSRSLLDVLKQLQREEVQAGLGQWLDKGQVKGLMSRRDHILELIEERIAERGEAAVLWP